MNSKYAGRTDPMKTNTEFLKQLSDSLFLSFH